MSGASIRPVRGDEVAACERILRALPEWFGIEEALRRYVADVPRLETLVAAEAGEVIGFLSIKRHNPSSAEIHVIGVHPDHHGRGIGRALMDAAEAALRADGTEFLQVKTLGPSRPNEPYERTRGFYRHLGFRPLEENDLWGEGNPCLILVKHLGCSG